MADLAVLVVLSRAKHLWEESRSLFQGLHLAHDPGKRCLDSLSWMLASAGLACIRIMLSARSRECFPSEMHPQVDSLCCLSPSCLRNITLRNPGERFRIRWCTSLSFAVYLTEVTFGKRCSVWGFLCKFLSKRLVKMVCYGNKYCIKGISTRNS